MNKNKITLLPAMMFLGCGLLAGSPGSARAADAERSDVAWIEVDASIKSTEYTLPLGDLRFKVTNLRPISPSPYQFRVIESMLLEPELDLQGALGNAAADNPCAEKAKEIQDDLKAAKSEAAVRDDLSQAREELESAECSPTALEREILVLREATSYKIPQQFVLREGREIKVQVLSGTRVISEQVFRAPAASAWLISYGFTFVRDKNEAYFSQAQADTAGAYTLRKSARDASFDFVPSVFVARRTEDQKTHAWCFDCRLSPVFGIGTDLENVSAFLGLGAMFGDNVMVTVGGAINRQDRLNGRYEVGQSIGEELSSEQLTESTWDTTYYIGLTYRLNSGTLSAVRAGGSKPTTEATPAKE